MAILGGAGNPVGGSFTGPAEALEIIGNHAYGYSGLQQINNSEVTHLDFTSGNYLFVGTVSMTGPVNAGDINNGENILFKCYLNSVAIFNIKMNPAGEGMPGDATIPIIIPAYTEVQVKAVSSSTSANYFTSCVVAGRIYRD